MEKDQEDNINYKQAGSVLIISICDDALLEGDYDFVNKLIKYIDPNYDCYPKQWLRTLLTCAWWPENEGIILSNRQEFFNKCMARFKSEMSEERAEKLIRRFEPGHK
jgi:hypothetical protein